MDIPSSGKGSGKRGRPSIGKPEHIRLSESEKAIALELGDDVQPRGVRLALRMIQHLNNQVESLEGIVKYNLEEDAYPSFLDPKELRRRMLYSLHVIETLQRESLEITGDPLLCAAPSRAVIGSGVERLFQAAELVSQSRGLIGEYEPPPPPPSIPRLSEPDLRTADKLGKGSAEDGMRLAILAVRFLGIETVRKLDNGSDNHATD